MGKALEEIDNVISAVQLRKDIEIRQLLLILSGLKAVIIALEDIASALRAR